MARETIRPVFKHNCTCCRHLGTVVADGAPVDLYVCDNAFKSRIARFGNEGGDYSSAPKGSQTSIPALRAANALALEFD